MCIQPKYMFCIIIFLAYANAQYFYSFVTEVNSFDATAFNNSHKIVSQQGEILSDTLHIVYHSSDSVYYIYTIDRGLSWSTPEPRFQGTYPAFDVDRYGFRYIAWQYFDVSDSSYDIYYDCLDDYSPPVNISESPENSILPDLVIDSGLVAHITWVEEVNGYNQIYYRTCQAGVLGDTLRLSDFGSSHAHHSNPSISIFKPNNRIYIMWDCFDPDSYSPFQIHYRYKENTTWSSTEYLASYLAMRHSSLDFSHGDDSLSFCYEDSSSGNLEATFCGGNGGGYSTPGRSMYPVISTCGITWSYLFWQEDSAGFADIYYHLYYEFGGGWYDQGSLRSLFNIQEPIRFPNCCGAYLVWTQGENLPYSLYFGDFGYPIGVEESGRPTHLPYLETSPNPFTRITEIRYQITDLHKTKDISLKIYDAAGRLVKQFNDLTIQPFNRVIWNGTDNVGKQVPAGTYFCILKNNCRILLSKIVKLK